MSGSPPDVTKYYCTTSKEVNQMSRNSKTVPEAAGALDNMKYEVAKSLGVNLKQGYNGDLTSKENGRVGGEMTRRLIEQAEKNMR